MTPLLLSAYTATTCLGRGLDATRHALREGRSGLAPCAFETVQLDTWIGEVAGVDDEALPEALAIYDCRNNRLTQMGLETDGFADHVRAVIARYGKTRVGVFLGTSTAGILQTEQAYRRRDPADGALPGDFSPLATGRFWVGNRHNLWEMPMGRISRCATLNNGVIMERIK